MSQYKQMIGVTKGIFTLLEIKGKNLGVFYCSVCNKKHEMAISSWKHKGRKRCGRKNTKHRLYDRYDKMIQRCHNPSNSKYHYYGGRGIKVCDRWLESFENFLEDMENSFKEGLELDRIDNNNDYTPENCRWVAHSQNTLNRRCFKNNKLGIKGIRKTVNGKYEGRTQINKVNYSTGYCETMEEAISKLEELKLTLYSEMNIEKPL